MRELCSRFQAIFTSIGVQNDGGTFDYRGLNISKETMLGLTEEVTGKRELPVFSKSVVRDGEAACHLRLLHGMVMNGTGEFGKEETFLFLISYIESAFL